MELIVRIVVSGVIIGVVSVIARTRPTIGGWLAAMPLTTLIATAWLLSERPDGSGLDTFYLGVLVGTLPSMLFLLSSYVTMRLGLPPLPSVLIGIAAWFFCTLLATRLGWFSI
jgi:hypothetical protein